MYAETQEAPFYSELYIYRPGDLLIHKPTGKQCVVLRQLDLNEDDFGMDDKYLIRLPCGRKTCSYGVELEQKAN